MTHNSGSDPDSFGLQGLEDDFDYFNRTDIDPNVEVRLTVLIPTGAIIESWFLGGGPNKLYIIYNV